MQRISLIVFFAINSLAFALPQVAIACDTVSTATPKSTCIVLEHNGVRGIWFALETANELRKHQLEVPELKLQISLHEQRAKIRDWQLEQYKEVVKLKDSAITTARTSMKSFAKTAREAQESEKEARDELGAWYRSPALWAGVGAIVVTAIVVVLEVNNIGK